MRPTNYPTIAALFVSPSGAYSGLPGVDAWDEARDASPVPVEVA